VQDPLMRGAPAGEGRGKLGMGHESFTGCRWRRWDGER
jgi:hypothetical protein